MTESVRRIGGRIRWLVMVGAILAGGPPGASSSTENPLEPPDRSSPRATLTTFLDSIDRTWKLYEAGDPGFDEPFRVARESLDASEIPPLVFEDFSAETALLLKEVLDRLELPPLEQVPDHAAVERLDLRRWTLPHTEIQLVRIADGDRQGQWLFSTVTVARAEEFYERVRHLPYQPGRTGGHIEELRTESPSIVLMKLVEVMPYQP